MTACRVARMMFSSASQAMSTSSMHEYRWHALYLQMQHAACCTTPVSLLLLAQQEV